MGKITIALAAAFVPGLCLSHAGELEQLHASFADVSHAQMADIRPGGPEIPAPSAALPPAALQQKETQVGADPILNALTDAQWNRILNSQPWEELVEQEASSKELFDNYRIRYIVKGHISFVVTPPTFTTEAGKVFVVVKYPGWLKEVGNVKICVEGYTKQRDDTREFVITRMLPYSAFDNIAPGADMLNQQRSPYITSRSASGYVLGNVNWSLAHAADGTRLTDQYGNFISQWQDGVTVNTALMENAYFVKKTILKPVKYGDHGYLIFTFKPGGIVLADGKSARGIVVTMDVYFKSPTDMSYSPVAALKNQYMAYYSIQTIERYFEFKFSRAPQSMTVYPLKITRAQQLRLLENSIKRSVENNQGEMYSLPLNSCANSALSLINSVLENNRKIKAGWLPEIVYRLRTTLPDSIAALLLRQGITGQPLPEVTAANYQHYSF